MFPLNTQKAEHVTHRDDGVLEVHSIFYTIQGEGPLAGCPAIFIRLAGCDLQCPDCDTDYTSKRQFINPPALVSDCMTALWDDTSQVIPSIRLKGTKQPPIIVFTGGEPLRQNIGPACRALFESGFQNIQVETNGTCWQDDVPIIPLIVVCSPKTPVIHERLKPYTKHLKYVLEEGQISEEDGLPTRGVLGSKLGPPCRPWPGFGGTVWVQPLDLQDPVQNKDNLQACINVVKKFGYRLSIQTHKTIGVE